MTDSESNLAARPTNLAHVANIAFLVLSVAALFWRVFLLGETLIDVAALNNQLPWGYEAGPSAYPYNRTDLTDTYLTRDYFVVQAYRDGETPLWNPYTMAGHPIYADGVTRTMSPFLLFYTFLDLPLGYSVARITELMLAAVFMYLFLIAIGVGARSAVLGALVFAFSAHSMLHLTGLGWWGGLMWLPLIFLFMDRAVTDRSYRSAILAGVFFAAQFYCGFMANQIYYAGAIVLFYLFFAFRGRSEDRQPAPAATVMSMMVVTLVVGFALSAVEWAPVMELLSYSNRRIVPTDQGYIYLPPWYLATLVFPNLFGAARDAEMLKLFTALNVSHDHILYLGISALAPLGFGIWACRRSGSRVTFFVLLGLTALVVMTAAPLYVHLTRFIPVVQAIRVITRAGVLFVFAASVLVGFGCDLLIKAERPALLRYERWVRNAVVLILGLSIVAVVAAYALRASGFFEGAFSERPLGSGARDFAWRAAAALSLQFLPPGTDILIPPALCIVLLLVIRGFSSGRLGADAFVLALIILLVPDLAWNSLQFNTTSERSRVFPRTAITDRLRSLPPGRVLVTPSDLETNRRAGQQQDKILAPPNTLLPYRISVVTGKDQLFPKSYREFCSLIEPQPNLSHVVFDKVRSPLLDLLNVRYVLTHQSEARIDSYTLLDNDEGVALYENPMAQPRAFFVSRAIPASTHEEALKLLRDPAFDPRSTAVIEPSVGKSGAPAIESMPGEAPAPANAPRIEADNRNLVVISTDTEEDGLLVLSDNYYPGWTAMVDEQPTEMFVANYTMRAVRVPAGKHVVYFEFDPPVFRISKYVSGASGAGVGLLLVFMVLRERRRGGEWR